MNLHPTLLYLNYFCISYLKHIDGMSTNWSWPKTTKIWRKLMSAYKREVNQIIKKNKIQELLSLRERKFKVVITSVVKGWPSLPQLRMQNCSTKFNTHWYSLLLKWYVHWLFFIKEWIHYIKFNHIVMSYYLPTNNFLKS